MHADLAAYLNAHEPLAEESAVWGNGTLPLRITSYLSEKMPPLHYVTSVRAVLFRGESVMVVRSIQNSIHIVPGGRREEGESLLETLRRELLEETGWTIANPVLLGFVHFHHLAPKPTGYPYPHPDFLQLIYTADAVRFVPEARVPSMYELNSGFRPIAAARTLNMDASLLLYLDAAVARRSASIN